MLKNNQLYLQGTDYEPGLEESTALIFKEIPSNKIIFLDACHSGGAKANPKDINKGIENWGKLLSETITITSSSADEHSHEDSAWENGAFTEAILQALGEGKADTDGNKIVTVNELYRYLQREVPKMVKQEKGQLQHPQLIINKAAAGEVGIFVVD